MKPDSRKLTKRQVHLLTLSDADIEAATAVFSFEFSDFTDRVSEGPPWIQLITGHLYLDHILSSMLSEGLAVPDAIETKRLSFSQRLQMCAALGLLPKSQVAAIEKVNSLRNRLAHSLSFKLDPKDILELTNATPKHVKDALKAEKGRAPGPLKLSELLIGITVFTEITRQSNAAGRLRDEHGQAKLAKALIRAQATLSGIPASD